MYQSGATSSIANPQVTHLRMLYLSCKHTPHMTSLTRAKQMTRMILLGMGALLVAIILFQGVLKFIDFLGPAGQDGQTVVANVGFGLVAEPKLPELNISAATTELSLDLVSGAFPEA